MKSLIPILLISFFCSCSKKSDTPAIIPSIFKITEVKLNDKNVQTNNFIPSGIPQLKVSFNAPINHTSINSNSINFSDGSGDVAYSITYLNNDSAILIQPGSTLKALTRYTIYLSPALKSVSDINLSASQSIKLLTPVDSSDKYSRISDNQLLDLIQSTTFKYFWDFGHPVSGMARERNSSGDVVTTGGTGFGVMSLIASVDRSFISRTEGLARMNKMVNFLLNNCTRYHGVFSHWINGSTGATVPFSPKDDGGDLVETSFLMQGLLCARQYFNGTSADEISLRNNINILWNGVEWNWYRQGNQNVLYWHWSPNNGWAINQKIGGWDEALVVYALAASSNTDSIPRLVYDNGWALNGGEKNGKSFFGITLPLGPDNGGPLFFSHYSFLGINPHSLTDAYADYWQQNVAHAQINYTYCKNNPGGNNLYSSAVWGLTASDDDNSGYAVHAPYNDDGVISPTAAISSIPYTPVESMNALRFYYYKLGDKLFGPYGFIDAFDTNTLWFSNSYLAIDQGPEIVMIENYRSGLLWNLFMSCPEIKRGMKHIGFQSPFLN